MQNYEEDKIYLLDPNDIISTNVNCRKEDLNEKKVLSMIETIKSGDELAPILCRPSKILIGTFEVIQGQHRREAYLRCNKKIRSFVKDLDDENARISSIRENMVRAKMKPIHIWNNCLYLYQIGKPMDEICSDMGGKSKQFCEDSIKIAYFVDDKIKEILNAKEKTLACYLCKVTKNHQNKLYNLLKSKKVKDGGMKNEYESYIIKNPRSVHKKSIKDIPILNLNKRQYKNISNINQKEEPYEISFLFSIGSEKIYATRKELEEILLLTENNKNLQKFSSMIQKQLSIT